MLVFSILEKNQGVTRLKKPQEEEEQQQRFCNILQPQKCHVNVIRDTVT